MLLVRLIRTLIFATLFYGVCMEDSGFDADPSDSTEHIGPAVAQVGRLPFVATILKNNNYECSAVILNTHWLLTISKCFHMSTRTYVYQRDLANYTIRVGSSYNHKGGSIYKIKILINNSDLQVTAVKAHAAIEFGPGVESANLPQPDAEPSMGNLAMMVAWTPTGHLRTISAPVIQPSICDDGETKLLPGQFICLGGVQDPDRHFCRKDTGGAVIQNKTLIGITTFAHTCALYTRAHAYPKLAAFALWLDSVIWDESDRPVPPTTTKAPITLRATVAETTSPPIDYQEYAVPFEPVNMQMEQVRDNRAPPRISLYESYLQNLERLKTSTTRDPSALDEGKREVMLKMNNLNKLVKMIPPPYNARKYDLYDYSD